VSEGIKSFVMTEWYTVFCSTFLYSLSSFLVLIPRGTSCNRCFGERSVSTCNIIRFESPADNHPISTRYETWKHIYYICSLIIGCKAFCLQKVTKEFTKPLTWFQLFSNRPKVRRLIASCSTLSVLLSCCEVEVGSTNRKQILPS
jgi:hypothetical protein